MSGSRLRKYAFQSNRHVRPGEGEELQSYPGRQLGDEIPGYSMNESSWYFEAEIGFSYRMLQYHIYFIVFLL
jgi:hypothetical protein